MYKIYKLTEKEKDKITRCHWDGDTYYYDVFESQEECDEEEKRLAKIEGEWRKKKEAYYKTITDNEPTFEISLNELIERETSDVV
jgi:hypothetical protein